MSNDPWADAPAPRISAHQVGRIIRLIEDYTVAEADALIVTLAGAKEPFRSSCCGPNAISNAHSRTCPTQGRD